MSVCVVAAVFIDVCQRRAIRQCFFGGCRAKNNFFNFGGVE